MSKLMSVRIACASTILITETKLKNTTSRPYFGKETGQEQQIAAYG